jgi:hypothetical protein
MSADDPITIDLMQAIGFCLAGLVVAGAMQFIAWGLIVRIQRRGDWTGVRQMLLVLAVVGPIFVFLVWLIQLGVQGVRGKGATANDWFALIAQPLWTCGVMLPSVWALTWCSEHSSVIPVFSLPASGA